MLKAVKESSSQAESAFTAPTLGTRHVPERNDPVQSIVSQLWAAFSRLVPFHMVLQSVPLVSYFSNCWCNMISKCTLCIARLSFDCCHSGAGGYCTWFIAKSYNGLKTTLAPSTGKQHRGIYGTEHRASLCPYLRSWGLQGEEPRSKSNTRSPEISSQSR